MFVTETNQLMLRSTIIGIYFGQRAKHMSKLRGQKFKILNVFFYNRRFAHLVPVNHSFISVEATWRL
jgi:hypothetical protein